MPSQATAFAPGRVNLIGEHTDYNDGLALPFAIEQGVTVSATVQHDRRIEAHAIDLGERDDFDLDHPGGASGWRAFVRGAVAELQRAGVRVAGARLEITGNVPRGAGLSSSAALEVALCTALIAVSGAQAPEAAELAELCSRIENEWVGANTGLLDQLASLHGEQGSAVLIDFRSLEVHRVALSLEDHRLVTLDSGESHEHAGSGYNERREQCTRAAELLGLTSLRDLTIAMAERLPAPLAQRATHVVTENARVRDSVAALESRDWGKLGSLLDASHSSLRDCFEVSTPAVERTVSRLKHAGALGARIHGGGFGGAVLALMAPGVRLPDGAIEVRPAAGAHLVSVS